MTQPIHNHTENFALDPFQTDVAETDIAQQKSPPPTYFHFTSYLIGLLTAFVLVGGMDLVLRRPEPAPIVLHPPPTAAPTATPMPTATPAPIVVFVSGAVRAPGMYALTPEARIGDALTAAGGMTLQANPSLVNQAERLWDGAQVHVPTMNRSTTSGTGSVNEIDTDTSNAVIPNTGTNGTEPPIGLSGSASALTGRTNLGENGLINVNTAAPTELETLPGIGPSKAAAIVANRPYNTIDALERVPGIGAKTVEQLRPLVTVE